MGLANAPHDLQLLKLYLLDLTGLDKDALHIYACLTVFIAIRLIWRRRGGWILAWLAALMLALGIEWLDVRAYGQAGTPRPDLNNWHDIWNGMAWPSVLFFAGPWLQPKPRGNRPGEEAKGSGDLADQPFEETAAI